MDSSLVITALTASILAIQLFRLSIAVIGKRRAGRVSLGDGDDESLRHAIRAQANFVEYTPLVLVLLGVAEYNGMSAWLLLPVAVAFIAGRILHPIGMASHDAPIRARVLGMHLTLWPLLVLAALNIVQVIVIAIQ